MRVTFTSWLAPQLEAFLGYKRSLGMKYEGPYVGILQRLDRHLTAHSDLAQTGLTGVLLLDFLGKLAHWKASSRRLAVIILQQLCRFLLRRGYVAADANPGNVLRAVRHAAHRPHIYSLEEIVRLLTSLQQEPGRHPFDAQMHFTLFHLVYACGLRVSEPVRLRVGDVDFGERTLFIRCSKFGKDRLLPVGGRAALYLEAYFQRRQELWGPADGSAPFFVRISQRPVTRDHLERIFQGARRRAGLVRPGQPAARIHDLRHTFAVHRLHKWYADGIPPQEKLVLLSSYMGHVKPAATQHYLNLSLDLLQLASRPMEQSFRQGWPELSEPPPGA